MYKYFLLSCLFLASCSQVPEQTLNNENCEDVKSVLVLQVLDNYILGWVDDEASYSTRKKYEPTNDHLIYVLKEEGKVYYPKQRIYFNAPLCLAYNGSYRYQKSDSIDQTFLIGSVEPSQWFF